MSNQIRVLIVDDHVDVRRSIQALLESQSDIKVVGVATDGKEAVTQARRLQPDVIIMDISMPKADGLRATQEIRTLGLGAMVIILSLHATWSLVQEALRRGAKGYIPKSQAMAELPKAIRTVNQGRVYLSPSVSSL